jgi:hypothetical protein
MEITFAKQIKNILYYIYGDEERFRKIFLKKWEKRKKYYK